jgi:hypothetical protein
MFEHTDVHLKAVKLFQDGIPALNELANAYQMLGSVGCQSIWQSGPEWGGGFPLRGEFVPTRRGRKSCLFAYLSWPSRPAAWQFLVIEVGRTQGSGRLCFDHCDEVICA